MESRGHAATPASEVQLVVAWFENHRIKEISGNVTETRWQWWWRTGDGSVSMLRTKRRPNCSHVCCTADHRHVELGGVVHCYQFRFELRLSLACGDLTCCAPCPHSMCYFVCCANVADAEDSACCVGTG